MLRYPPSLLPPLYPLSQWSSQLASGESRFISTIVLPFCVTSSNFLLLFSSGLRPLMVSPPGFGSFNWLYSGMTILFWPLCVCVFAAISIIQMGCTVFLSVKVDVGNPPPPHVHLKDLIPRFHRGRMSPDYEHFVPLRPLEANERKSTDGFPLP